MHEQAGELQFRKVLNAWLIGQGLRVMAFAPQQLSLEDLFLQIMEAPTAEESIA